MAEPEFVVVFDGTRDRPWGRQLFIPPEQPAERPLQRATLPATPRTPPSLKPQQLRSQQALASILAALAATPQTMTELQTTLGWRKGRTEYWFDVLRRHGRVKIVERRAVAAGTFGRRYDSVWSVIVTS